MTVYERKQLWQQRVEGFKASGQNKTTWCKENNIDIKSFYRWNRKLNDLEHGEPNAEHRFILAETKSTVNTSSITIRIGKASINVTRGFDPDTLSDVLRVVCNLC